MTYKISKISHSQTPFLTIITRKYGNKRPVGFHANQGSIQGQSDPDLEQIFITDEIGQGLHAANKSFSLPAVTSQVLGEYIYLLDDDDFLTYNEFISDLKLVAENQSFPDVIFFKMKIKLGQLPGDIYPDALCWENKPLPARIGGSCFVVKREVFLRHVATFGQPRMGDFTFINEIWESGVHCYWWDKLCAETSKVGRGLPE